MLSSQTGLWCRNAHRTKRVVFGGIIALALAGCDETGQFALNPAQSQASTEVNQPTPSTKLVERDVEAPEIFQVTDEGLWDGRPSLGGVWVAHPDVSDPERVIIRNETNGKFVVGALFRKERELPGPPVQISSDAAAALSILAGAPTELNVTALRREETEELVPVDVEEDPILAESTKAVDAPPEITEASLDPIAAASAAIETAPPTPTEAADPEGPAVSDDAAIDTENTQAAVETPPAKPFIQIGIFSREQNAKRAARRMTSAGIIPTVKRSEANGQAFWRVVVGPATSSAEITTLTDTIRAQGFADAYAVAN